MLKLSKKSPSFLISFLIVVVIHIIILFFVKKNTYQELLLSMPTKPIQKRANKIDFISKEDLERIKRVGIKQGNKKLLQPDFLKTAQPSLPLQSAPVKGAKNSPSKPQPQPTISNQPVDESSSTFTLKKMPPEEKVIAPSNSHEVLKQDTMRNLSFNKNSIAAQKISNFEIRYERPEGVSEDELNSDEKAFYSFYKRSYASYVAKLFSTYDQIAVNHPGIHRAFENKHLLVGRIDYDENGNIITVKILKSSENDDVHQFFEETLKKLVLPNPPKIFLKRKKEFSIYYQVQVN